MENQLKNYHYDPFWPAIIYGFSCGLPLIGSFTICFYGVYFFPAFICKNWNKNKLFLFYCSIIGVMLGISIGMWCNIVYIAPVIMRENSTDSTQINLGRFYMIQLGCIVVGFCSFVTSIIFTGLGQLCFNPIFNIIERCSIVYCDNCCHSMCCLNFKYICCNIPITIPIAIPVQQPSKPTPACSST